MRWFWALAVLTPALLVAPMGSASEGGIPVEPIASLSYAEANVGDSVSFTWGYCGGGSPEFVVARLNQPYLLLDHLSGQLLGNPTVAWAPDGTAFATEHFAGGIAIVDVLTGALSRITFGDDVAPSWRNDGSAIAFTRRGDAGEAWDLWQVHADGSGLEQITDTPETWEYGPAWSPDDSQIAYAVSESRDSGFDIWVMNVDLTGLTNLTNDPLFFYQDLAWSPNGSELAVTAFTSGYPDIVIVNLSGRPQRNLTVDETFLSAFDPAWSPDGRRIAHSRQSGNGGSDIWVMDPEGAEAVQWSDLEECASNPAWEPLPSAHSFASEPVTFFGDAPPITMVHGIEAHLFGRDISWLADSGVTKGCNPPRNSRYCPDNFVTRGQMAAFLVRAFNLTEQLVNPFTDDDGSIFEADIEKLAAAGVTKGCNPSEGNTKFCPDGKVTREQMAAFLVRALHYTDDGGGDLFTDDDGSIFEGDIDRLGTAGVTKGCNPAEGNTKFCPTGYVSRGQMAAFLHRALS